VTARPDNGEGSAVIRELTGCRVLVTRERPGELGRMLAERGADVVHVPIIVVTDPPDDGAALQRELDRLDRYSWLVVTSPAGAERVGDVASLHPHIRLAAVGAVTEQRLAALAGRPVDLVPHRQLAAVLGEELIDRCPEPVTILVAQADRAGDALGSQLSGAGHDVTSVMAYSTVLVEPDVAAADGADVLVLASGSAAEGWVNAFGVQRPPIVVAIGPSTAAKAQQNGLKVDGIAADHSLEGLVDEVVRQVVRHQAEGRT
jgi:uroporphyrinogen-III synthase